MIEDIQKSILDEFQSLTTWEERYQWLIDIGNHLNPNPDIQQDQYLVRGCQSKTWFHICLVDEKIVLKGYSESVLMRGLISILISLLSGETKEAIQKFDFDFFNKLGIIDNLTTLRRSGFTSIIEATKKGLTWKN